MDVANLGAKKTLVVTDPNIAKLPAFTNTVQSLDASGVTFDTYTDVVVEPTDKSYQHLIDFARAGNYDCYVAVGGGSVMDSAKAANLYVCNPEAELLDFVNAPVGKGMLDGCGAYLWQQVVMDHDSWPWLCCTQACLSPRLSSPSSVCQLPPVPAVRRLALPFSTTRHSTSVSHGITAWP